MRSARRCPRCTSSPRAALRSAPASTLPAGFDQAMADELGRSTGIAFEPARNKFEALASNDGLVFFSGALNTLAVALTKIANYIPSCSGPGRARLRRAAHARERARQLDHAGQGQPDAVRDADHGRRAGDRQPPTVSFGGPQGHLELNILKPVMGHTVLGSIQLLANGRRASQRPLRRRDRAGPAADRGALDQQALMLVTALAPQIGYDKASKIAKKAWAEGTTLRAAALALGFTTAEEFDALRAPAGHARQLKAASGCDHGDRPAGARPAPQGAGKAADRGLARCRRNEHGGKQVAKLSTGSRHRSLHSYCAHPDSAAASPFPPRTDHHKEAIMKARTLYPRPADHLRRHRLCHLGQHFLAREERSDRRRGRRRGRCCGDQRRHPRHRGWCRHRWRHR